jgi:chromatin segregation and condensation protein Rec8/ScpA/Scc1 (kleisin family)
VAPLADHSVWKLIEAFGRILEKAGHQAATHDVVVDRISVNDRINQLCDRLAAADGSIRFEACFDLGLSAPELRHQMVVTLLAILELARLRAVRVLQSPDEETLFITRVDGAALEAARRTRVTSAAEGEGEGHEGEGHESEGQEEDEGHEEA